jgi:predicted dinucleotide-binding enzyme
MPDPIPIIGGTGALGWGLALRLGGAGDRVAKR